MQGFQLTFMTEQDRRIEGKPVIEWLLHLAKGVGCSGATTFVGTESFGGDGKRHSAHFIELADQPVQVMLAVSEGQAQAILKKIEQVHTRLFFMKTPIEYGSVGTEADSP